MQREINRNHTGDWDEQLERLSTYLDGELDEGEREALERHLPTCEQCQRTLDDLREVRALLRAMPTPALPRSFAIPTTGEVPVPLAAALNERAERTGQPLRGRGGRWSAALQAVGGFVAAAGVILVLGSALTGLGPRGSSASTATGSSAQAPQQSQNGNTSTAYGSQQSTATSKALQHAGTPSADSAPTPVPTDTRQHQPLYGGPMTSSGNPPVVPIGAGMVAGGTVLFVVGRVANRRRRRE